MQRLAWVILSLRANCVSSLRNWRTNLQPLKVRWPWLPVGLHRTLMIIPPPFFMVFRRRRLWFFNNRAIFMVSRPQLLVCLWFFSNLAILIICRWQLLVSITTMLLLHPNTSFYMKSTFHINGNLIPKSLLLHTNTVSASLDLETKSNIRCICKRIDALFYAPQSLELIIVLPPRSTHLILIPTLSDSLIFDSFFLLFFFSSSI